MAAGHDRVFTTIEIQVGKLHPPADQLHAGRANPTGLTRVDEHATPRVGKQQVIFPLKIGDEQVEATRATRVGGIDSHARLDPSH